ncbi:hypothetical protein RN70_11980 [Staphylococcus schleiferi]|uniref:DUF1430 domain-containing protein n=1 Tax=Staphylococcus coagulans TaxID=74706 RepID=A0ABU1F0U3_9STAP|nr:DUF1430 domain-containing protein [Staphylococcus coagulans]AKS72266.1 hypothetical protein OA96_10965 [Staphylococcus schleiferi]AKS74554.1 hypothetical protein RN70_11980 [Staphylococcus schleiferi]MBA8771965.1 DUF1430 domain-containing protein [Staphylococcus coagulans]MBT2832860.1 DUF1430 domain-containing protein [Staphylococcus coagulans]MDR5603994.1 DUF1430 domain-containing protein [Staphylococcus coagulans]
MKRIILILAVAISLIINFVVIDSVKSLSFYNAVEKQSEKVRFAFDKDKAYSKNASTYFESLSKKYNVAITKVTYLSDDKVAINTTDQQLKQKATHNHTLNLFDRHLHIKVYNLKDTNLSEEGTYFFKGDTESVQKVIELINRNVGSTEKVENTVSQHIQIDAFSIILSTLFLFIFLAVLIHSLQNRKSDGKLLYDLGYSWWHQLQFLLADFKYYAFGYVGINIVLSALVYIFIYKDVHLTKVVLIALCTSIVLMVTCIAMMSVVLAIYTKQYAKNMKQSAPFLMMYTYMALAVMAVIFLSLSSQNLVQNYRNYKFQQSSIKYWDVSKNAYKTLVSDQGQLKNEKLAEQLGKHLKDYYNSAYNKGFIIDVGNFYNTDGRPLYKLNEKENANIEPDGKTITIDINYLKTHKRHTIQGQNVLDDIQRDSRTQNIIVPIKYKQYEKEIEVQFKDHFAFLKNEDISNDKQKENLNINIIWVDNNVGYPTYDFEVGGRKNTLIAPIAIVETGNTALRNFETYFSTRYVFKSKSDDPYSTIKKGLEKFHVDGYIPSVESVYDAKFDEINRLKVKTSQYAVLALLTTLTFIVMTFTFIRLYFTSYQHKIFIKHTLGYSYFQIHKPILTFLLLLNLLMGILILSQQNIISYSIFFGVILIETWVSSYSFIKLNKENLNEVLKGKKDD